MEGQDINVRGDCWLRGAQNETKETVKECVMAPSGSGWTGKRPGRHMRPTSKRRHIGGDDGVRDGRRMTRRKCDR